MEIERGGRIIALPILTSTLDGGGCGSVQSHTPFALPLKKKPGTQFTGDCLDPTAGLDRYGKSRPHRICNPEPSIP
jgi:hypothetical protein